MNCKAAVGSERMQSLSLPKPLRQAAKTDPSRRDKEVLADQAYSAKKLGFDLTGNGKPLKSFELGICMIRFLL